MSSDIGISLTVWGPIDEVDRFRRTAEGPEPDFGDCPGNQTGPWTILSPNQLLPIPPDVRMSKGDVEDDWIWEHWGMFHIYTRYAMLRMNDGIWVYDNSFGAANPSWTKQPLDTPDESLQKATLGVLSYYCDVVNYRTVHLITNVSRLYPDLAFSIREIPDEFLFETVYCVMNGYCVYSKFHDYTHGGCGHYEPPCRIVLNGRTIDDMGENMICPDNLLYVWDEVDMNGMAMTITGTIDYIRVPVRTLLDVLDVSQQCGMAEDAVVQEVQAGRLKAIHLPFCGESLCRYRFTQAYVDDFASSMGITLRAPVTKLLDVFDAAHRCGVTRETIERAVADGSLQAIKVPYTERRGRWRFTADAVDAYATPA